MKKLYVKTVNGYELVFCNNYGKIVTTKDKSKALPRKSIWALDDLRYFQTKFANNEFILM